MTSIEQIFEQAKEAAQDSYEYRRVLEEFLSTLSFEAKHIQHNHVVTLNRSAKLIFVGDVHGDLQTLYELFTKRLDVDRHLRECGYIVFLGDYVDRGPYQLEVLAFVAMLKSLWSSQVFTLRGNHEPPPWLPPYPHDYPYHLATRFGRDEAEQLYELSQHVFEHMPLLLHIPGHLLAVHGGPPISRLLRYGSPEEILAIDDDREAIEEILWSDPIEEEIEWSFSYRGAGKLWGTTVTKQALSKLKIRAVIRGHEPCIAGYKLNHENRVLTLFTMKGYYGNVSAAIAVIDLERESWHEELEKHIIVV